MYCLETESEFQINEIVVLSDKAKQLAFEYAGFESAADLTPDEQIQSLSTLVPVALEIVDEARDTIERMHNDLNEYKIREITNIVADNSRGFRAAVNWWSVSIPELDKLTPNQMVQRDKVDDLLNYVKEFYR